MTVEELYGRLREHARKVYDVELKEWVPTDFIAVSDAGRIAEDYHKANKEPQVSTTV